MKCVAPETGRLRPGEPKDRHTEGRQTPHAARSRGLDEPDLRDVGVRDRLCRRQHADDLEATTVTGEDPVPDAPATPERRERSDRPAELVLECEAVSSSLFAGLGWWRQSHGMAPFSTSSVTQNRGSSVRWGDEPRPVPGSGRVRARTVRLRASIIFALRAGRRNGRSQHRHPLDTRRGRGSRATAGVTGAGGVPGMATAAADAARGPRRRDPRARAPR